MTRQLKIASLNITRILLDQRKLLLTQFCISNDFDVVGLQEVRFSDPEPFLPFYTFIANPEFERGGTGLLIKSGLKIANVVRGGEGRILSATVENISIVNIYAPAGRHWKEERNLFFQSVLPPYISTSTPVLLLGDFNAIEYACDRVSTGGTDRESICRALVAFTSAFKLIDVWRHLKPDEPGHTFIHPAGSSRLDRFYVNSPEVIEVSDIHVFPTNLSDHLCIHIDIHVPTSHRHKKKHCIWKMNTSVFQDEEYQQKVKFFVENARKHYLRQHCAAQWWEEIFKPGIKKISVDYCRQKCQWIKSTQKFFQQCLTELLKNSSGNPTYLEEYREIQQHSRQWETNVMKGIALRSKTFNYSPDETPSIHHVQQEQRIQGNASISTLRNKDGQTLSNKESISLEIHQHFSQQFENLADHSSHLPNLLRYVEECPTDKFTPSMKENLEKPIEKHELQNALNKAKRNKSPGIDGIPSEFYAFFWDYLADDMIDMMNQVLQREAVTPTQSLAIVKLIPKKAKPEVITDYRPISLLCNDYKLLASILATRLGKTLQVTTSTSQRGGVPGRKIERNLSLVRDVIHFLDEREVGGALVAIDLSKAFDLVDRSIVWAIMEKMGYPSTFIAYLQALYSNVSLKFLFGDGITEEISGKVSIRQGCPLSTQLFVIYLEPLLGCLNQQLCGINVLNHSVKTCAFLDDVNIFVGSNQDLLKTKAILTNFCSWTGAFLNESKTHIMGLGAWKDRADWSITWATSASHIKILGVVFFPSTDTTIENGWKSIRGLIVGLLKDNNMRLLTIHQRVNFIKLHVLNKANFVSRILPCPKKVADEILKSLLSFVWEGSIERTKQSVLFLPQESGGLGLPNPGILFRCLHLKTTFGILRGEHGVERRLLDFWLAFPLRTVINNYVKNSLPYSILSCPCQFKTLVEDAKSLTQAKLVRFDDATLNHRLIYKSKIEEISFPGKLEIRLNYLNWKTIWSNIKSLPPFLKDVMFRLNHDILPTRERQKKTNQNTSNICQECNTDVETSIHLFVECTKRDHAFTWLKKTVNSLNVHPKTSEQLLRLDLENSKKMPQVCLVISYYVEKLWKYRRRGKIPTERELTIMWENILKKHKTN